jgi:hypothetical protein
MFIAFSAECKLSASFLECTQCQMLSDLAVFTSNRECAKHCVWCGRVRHHGPGATGANTHTASAAHRLYHHAAAQLDAQRFVTEQATQPIGGTPCIAVGEFEGDVGVRVQVDDDASPGVLCVSVRVAVFGGGAWGEW